MTASKSPKPPRIQALARASAIIDVIAAGDTEGTRLGEICRVTKLNKTTAFNLLASLVVLGFVEQDKRSRRYRLGLRNLELGRIVKQRLHISHLSRPILADLCKKTNETVNLGLPDLLDLWVIDSYQGSRLLYATAYGGWRSMYHCTALGKAFLSFWDAPMRHTVYRLRGLPRLTPRTITDVDTLEAQLDRFKAQGYAVDVGENEVGVNGIARAIVDGMGDVAAAVSVAGHSSRLTEDVMEKIAPHVIAAADAISAALEHGEHPANRDSRRRQ
ncbi:MAG: IclR family transcriptional regulator [Paracoccaceae bacterium]